MPPKKRPYVPKTKGCHQCARRRIHCDLSGPQCQKCISRGLHCTGINLELRLVPHEASAAEDDQFSWSQSTQWDDAAQVYDLTDGQHQELSSLSPKLMTSEVDEGITTTFDTRLLRPLPEHTELWKRQLCSHFSKHIAFEMVAVDGMDNSWRHLVLPFAFQDELVMNSVLTVSAFHLHLINSPRPTQSSAAALSLDSFPLNLHQLDQAVLSGLRRYSQLGTSDPMRNQAILTAILVLQVGAMVTGRSDFPSLYRMLSSAFEAMGGEEGLGGGDACDFISSQVYKFRFYGATLLDEQAALEVVSSPIHSSRLLDCLSRRWSDHPQHRQTVTFVNDLVRQALDMYLDQAHFISEVAEASAAAAAADTDTDRDEGESSLLASPEMSDRLAGSVVRVQHFIETLKALWGSHIGASCEQVLVWASFIAASACVLPEHIEFFENVFQRHYERNGFLNVLVALETLRRIWSRRCTSERWTSLVAQTKKLVM